jgi:hypothetical protein
MSTMEFVLSLIISFILGVVVLYVIFRVVFFKRYIEEGKRFAVLEHSELRNLQVNEQLQKLKETEEFKALLEVQYLRGVDEGGKLTMNKFSLKYEPFVEIKDNYIKRTAEIGYYMQLNYDGFPIGDQMKTVTNYEEKFKEENIKYLVDTVIITINNYINKLTPYGIASQLNTEPRIQRIKKSPISLGK